MKEFAFFGVRLPGGAFCGGGTERKKRRGDKPFSARQWTMLFLLLTAFSCLSGCERKEPLVYSVNKSDELQEYEAELEAESAYEESKVQEAIAVSEAAVAESLAQEALIWHKKEVDAERVAVKGIYLTDGVAGSSRMDEIISHIDATELNAVVIDIKGDGGMLGCRLEGPLIHEIAFPTANIPDLPALLSRLHSHGIYTIARCVAFRDPHIVEVRPEWMNTRADGSIFYDNAHIPWVNPYKREYWEYLAEIGEQCADAGFDEVQFDYVRFCTEKGMSEVVYDEADTGGLGKTEIILEFVQFLSDRMAAKGVFFSIDVFGTIIGSYVDTMAVGQDYAALASCVDYMCPMIYPSHYGNGNFGLDYPDTEPYLTIKGAMEASRKELEPEEGEETEGAYHAIVRPWLQDFTASWLSHYIRYGPQEVRAQIQAVYDSGHEEWLVWNASNNYDWEAFY